MQPSTSEQVPPKRWWWPCVLALLAAACTLEAQDRSTPTSGTDGAKERISIDVTAPGFAIDRRLLGTNVPAWLGPDRLASAWLQDAIAQAGITAIRMPGGSWSNNYGWSACELRLAAGCIWDGAARPSDYAALLTETGLEGIWTVSINETAESAAALVAFFNGSVGDPRPIGADRHGVDWGTVGDWAAARAEGGRPEPVRIDLWEVGNEVYGGRPDVGGEQCAPFGWESVWTCDGREYVHGDDRHDGFLDIRRAMLDVDPTIQVGAVGVADPDSWSDWGNEVIAEAGDALDFYVVHHYGFDASPDPSAVATRAGEAWPAIVGELRRSLDESIPIAVTEYNLVSFEGGDTRRSMTTVASALYIADTIGQFAANRIAIANHWNLANGTTKSGTDYGIIDADTGARFPAFEAMATWGRAGDELLPAVAATPACEGSVYPTRRPDGAVVVIVLHPSSRSCEMDFELLGLGEASTVTSTSRGAASPDAGQFEPAKRIELTSVDGVVEVLLPPWSITELEIRVPK